VTDHTRQTIAVLIAYGPEYRAFIQSGLIDRLLERWRVVLFSARPIAALSPNSSVESKPFPDQDLCRDFLSRVKSYSPLAHRWLHQNVSGPIAWRRALMRDDVAALLIATYSGLRIQPAVRAANSLKFPVHAVLNSWKDSYKNPRLGSTFESIGVFDRDTEYDLAFANHWYDRRRIYPIGSLHLDAFLREEPLPRDDFCSLAGLDPRRPFWCYSAAEPGVDLGEAAALRELVLALGKLRPRTQLLVRLNPRDTQERFSGIPGVVFQRPHWEVEMSADWNLPLDDDLRVWRSTVEHAEGNLSARSTVSAEFASLGKPVVNLNYLEDGLIPRQRRAYSRIFEKFTTAADSPSEAAQLSSVAVLVSAASRSSLPFGESAVDRVLRAITPKMAAAPAPAVSAQVA
jgi:hypothetical protein